MRSRFAVLAGAATTIAVQAAVASAQSPTFTKDVAPVLFTHCVVCHHPRGDAPFSLLTYDEAKRHAKQIAAVTLRRSMPPWKPDADSPAFAGQRRLSDDQIAVIGQWVKAGAPKGRAADLPSPPVLADGWLAGAPDLIVALPSYTLRADGADVFRNFVVPVPANAARTARFVRGLQFRPRSRAVHHANIRVDPTDNSRKLDVADPEPGYEGVILHSADFPDGHFLGWTPGQAAPPSSELAWRLDAGADLVVQLHMRPTGREEQVAPLIGLYFTNDPPLRIPALVRLGRQNLDIAPGAADFRVGDSFVLPVDAQVAAIQPHAHYRAHDVVATAALPDGTSRMLIHIGDWDFNWQDQYRLASPFWLPAGTTLSMTYTFDNSVKNARNPTHPPERVAWGWRSTDEMGDVWIQLLTRGDADRRRLDDAARRKMTAEDAIGVEVLIARDPAHVNLRHDAAEIYQALGQPDRALEHLAAAVRLEPQSATARRRLADLLYTTRRLDAAMTAYREAVRLDPADVSARCSLARALTETDRPADAVIEYRAALKERPDWAPCAINFAWLLSAHADASIRRPHEAVRLAERAVALAGRDNPDALDVLAAAYASAGRFDDAVRTGEAALALEQGARRRQPSGLRERVELYRRRLPFIIPER